jgi:hypothetical protein
MRWRVTIAAALILAVLLGGTVCRTKVRQQCSLVETLLLQAAAELRPELLEEADRLWERGLPLLSCLLPHDRLERVGEGLARAEGFLKAGDRPSFFAQIEALLYLLDDIREYDYINFQTLL